MEDLSHRQQEILEFIIKETQSKGIPIGTRNRRSGRLKFEFFGPRPFGETTTARLHQKDPTKPRAIEVLRPNLETAELFSPEVIPVPVVGRVTA